MLPALLVLDSLVMLLLLLAVVRRAESPGAFPFFGMLTGVFLYNFGYGMELLAQPGVMSYFWNHFQYWGISTLPAFWLWLSLETPMQERLRSRPLIALLFVIPALTLAFNLTNDWHHWYYASLDFTRVGDLTLARIVRGPWYSVHIGYSVVVFVLALVFFWLKWRKLQKGYGSMALGLVGGSAFLWGSVVLYEFGLVPDSLDVTPIGLTLSALTYYWVLWPARLFEMIPLSREMVFRLIPEAVVVLDRASRLVDWNPAAVELFPALADGKRTWPLERVVAERSWLETLRDPHFVTPTTLSLTKNALTTWWSIAPTPVTDRTGKAQGRVLVFRDVTEQVAKDHLLARLDLTDAETGLFKETAFRERAVAQVLHRSRRGEPVSLVLLHLETLQQHRETWGELPARAWLRTALALWGSLLGPHDLLARLEHDRFALLLPGLVPAKALSLAESLCTRLRAEPLEFEGQEVTITARFGVSGILRTEAGAFDQLWERAEAALSKTMDSTTGAVGCLAGEDGLVNTCLEEEGDA